VNTHKCTEHGAVACTWLLSEYDRDFGPLNMTQKYKHMYNLRIVSSLKQSSTVYMVCCTLAAHHVLCRTHARHDVAYTKMAWTDGALSPSFLTCTIAPIAEW